VSEARIINLDDVYEDDHNPIFQLPFLALSADQVIVFPTDTVYGLLCPVESAQSYHRVYELKGRSFDKPLALLTHKGFEIYRFAVNLCRQRCLQESDIEAFETGRVTLVFNPSDLPCLWSKVQELQPGSVGLRCPSTHLQPRPLRGHLEMLIGNLGGLVWATSVNRSGEPPATTADEVLAWLDELEELEVAPPELVVLSDTPGSGTPSGVLDLTGPEPRRLR
jgi:L-threonylcarbamoyladenylate synthase